MTRQPRIGIVFRLDQPGGVQSCIFSLVRGLNQRGLRPVVLWDRPPSASLLEEGECEIEFVPIRLPIPSPAIDRMPHSLRFLARAVGAIPDRYLPRNIDFFFIFYAPTLISPSRPHLYYLSGPPLVKSLRSRSLGGQPSLLQKLTGFLYERLLEGHWPAYVRRDGCRYVINSRFSAEAFRREHGHAIPVVYPPIRGETHALTKADLERRNGVVFFSRLEPSKRPEMVLDLAAAFPGMHFVIMGGVSRNRVRYLKALRRMKKNRRLGNVSILPNVSRGALDARLREARYYFFPSVNEHFGITTGEAVVAGSIPLVHDSGGQRELVPIGELRFNDAEMVAKARNLFSADDETLLAWQKVLTTHMTQFSEEEFVGKMLSYVPEGMIP